MSCEENLQKLHLSANYKPTFEKLELLRIHEELLYEVLYKLETKPLVILRRTCHTLNSMVEERLKIFASRPLLGISVKIKVLDCRKINVFTTKPWRMVIPPVQGNDEIVVKRLSGISFKSIAIECSYVDNRYLEIVEFMKQLNPMCIEFQADENTPMELIGPLTDHLTIVDQCKFWFRESGLESDKFFTTLQLANNREMFSLFWDGSEVEANIFEKAKHFHRVNMVATSEAVRDLLWDIHSSTKNVCIRHLALCFRDENISFTLSKHMPQLPPLISLPKNYSDREKHKHLFDSNQYLLMSRELAVISEYRYRGSTQIHVNFVGNTYEEVTQRVCNLYAVSAGQQISEDVNDEICCIVASLL